MVKSGFVIYEHGEAPQSRRANRQLQRDDTAFGPAQQERNRPVAWPLIPGGGPTEPSEARVGRKRGSVEPWSSGSCDPAGVGMKQSI